MSFIQPKESNCYVRNTAPSPPLPTKKFLRFLIRYPPKEKFQVKLSSTKKSKNLQNETTTKNNTFAGLILKALGFDHRFLAWSQTSTFIPAEKKNAFHVFHSTKGKQLLCAKHCTLPPSPHKKVFKISD